MPDICVQLNKQTNKQTKWMKCQVMGNQIKEEKFEICIKSVYRYERRKGRKEKLVKSLTYLNHKYFVCNNHALYIIALNVMGCLHQVDIKRCSLTYYTELIIAPPPLSWRWGRIPTCVRFPSVLKLLNLQEPRAPYDGFRSDNFKSVRLLWGGI